MANKLLKRKEKKLPNLTISIENEIALAYKIWCGNHNTTVSRELRNYIKNVLIKDGKKF